LVAVGQQPDCLGEIQRSMSITNWITLPPALHPKQ
jgi:hypothetical protein